MKFPGRPSILLPFGVMSVWETAGSETGNITIPGTGEEKKNLAFNFANGLNFPTGDDDENAKAA